MMKNAILIIDFGSQVTQLIARRLREEGVYTEILPSTSVQGLEKEGALSHIGGIILSGGPNSVTHADTPRAPQARAHGPLRARGPPGPARAAAPRGARAPARRRACAPGDAGARTGLLSVADAFEGVAERCHCYQTLSRLARECFV